MRARSFQMALAVAASSACLILLAVNGVAQTATNATPAPPLAYGVAEILKMAQAKVSDDTIIAYIKGSGRSYGLNAKQIIYLHKQGISDAVITTMLNQPKPASAPATVPVPTTSAPQPVLSAAYEQPTKIYVESEPTVYYDYEPYYYPVYSYNYWPWPVVVSHGWGGYWYGGWHGWHRGGTGWHRGSVVHNGGFVHGGGHTGWRR